MKTAMSPLQTAAYNRLKNDAALTSRVTGVFDAVPASQAFPYVTIGDFTSTDDSTKTFNREDMTATLHAWSRYNGKKEAQEILSLTLESITREPLQLNGGFSVEFNQLEMLEVFTDPDGMTRHGVLRIRFKIKQ